MRTVQCTDLDEKIAEFQQLGYRLDMIMPADAPREVQLSKDNEVVRLIGNPESIHTLPFNNSNDSWITGRAGMMYRDLLPGRLGGKLIASHIRLNEAGPVPDYVHYHKIDFQLIYCLKGRIRVVYEDQGEPFWLEPGDCVLQPPVIRHRVLEAEAGSEVLELSSPAEHETWVEHELTLPTAEVNADRLFDGQRFVRSIAKDAIWNPSEIPGADERDLGIYEATGGLVDGRIRRTTNADLMAAFSPRSRMIGLGFVVAGREKAGTDSMENVVVIDHSTEMVAAEILRIEFRDRRSENTIRH